MLYDAKDLPDKLSPEINKDGFDSTEEIGNIPSNKRLNMSMIVPNSSKYVSEIPSNRELDKPKLLENTRRSTDIGYRTKNSFNTSKSVASDRLVDYKNMKNNRHHNLSTHEQFNAEIINNTSSWGEYAGNGNSKTILKMGKYGNAMMKHSLVPDLLVTKRRVLNHKRRDFWNWSLADKQSLPPPPMGKSYGHGILSKKIAKSKEREGSSKRHNLSQRC